MKCPKCGYLGFEEVDRCRNCGYDFSLASLASVPELGLNRESGDDGPLDDLSFLSEALPARNATPADLPLFGRPTAEDQPLVTKAALPRVPLAVRRATQEVPRVRAESRAQTFELAFEAEPLASASLRTRVARAGKPAPFVVRSQRAEVAAPQDASLSRRFVAMVLDLFILAGVDVLVVYLTMQFCGLTLGDLSVLPKAPLLAFLSVQNVGYLVAFTVAGQTLGKMAVGIRVIAADEAEPLDLGRSVRRTLVWLLLAIPAGLGFLSALLNRDRRGLHDRLAGTRVVRASA